MEAALATETPAAAPAPHNPRRTTQILMPDRMSLRENTVQDWVVDLPVTATLDDALEPSFWAHNADRMQPSDQIILRAEDGSWIAYLVVAYCERNYAKVVLDRCIKLDADTTAPVTTIKHFVQWKGPRLKYCVIRTADSALLKEGCLTKDEASSWMRDHENTMRR